MVYADPPWKFRGRALYQLHLVKEDVARQFLPQELHPKLVSLFGYTLGGFFLARYDDSPVGAFNELVVISGLLWNPPTSCAWAARIFVDDKEAKQHGVHEVGLPSAVGRFTASGGSPTATWWSQERPDGSPDGTVQLAASSSRRTPWWQPFGRTTQVPLCSFDLPPARPSHQWPGPRLRIFMPSFSGCTEAVPQLLKYSCALSACIRPVGPARVSALAPEDHDDAYPGAGSLAGVLMGRPLLALAFDEMDMAVQDKPVAVKGDTAGRDVALAAA